MIKRAWVRRYDQLPTLRNRFIIQSWDTANKDGGQNGWSVCTTWLVHEHKYYLIDVLRGRFDYPSLKARVLEHARCHGPSKILVEGAQIARKRLIFLGCDGVRTSILVHVSASNVHLRFRSKLSLETTSNAVVEWWHDEAGW
jgi:phage terminase large subunit-like protein